MTNYKSILVVVSVAILIGMLGSIGLSQRNNQVQEQRSRDNRGFSYATLEMFSTTLEDQQPEYVALWNDGDFVLHETSRESQLDANRRLLGRLGKGNNRNINLSLLLTAIGERGFELVETESNGTGTLRIFIRRN